MSSLFAYAILISSLTEMAETLFPSVWTWTPALCSGWHGECVVRVCAMALAPHTCIRVAMFCLLSVGGTVWTDLQGVYVTACLLYVVCVFVYALLGLIWLNWVVTSPLCICFSFISLSLEVSDVRIKSSIKDKKLFWIICIHVCLWLLLSTTSAHTWSWVLLCACLFA